MKTLVTQAARRLRRMLGSDSVRYRSVVLPAGEYRPCGVRFHDDAYFLSSAEAEVDRLATHCGLRPASRVLDVGCGVGRLAIGLISRLGALEAYHGVDVSRRSIDWCRRHITSQHPHFQFTHLDVSNARYNPDGQSIDADFQLPFGPGSFDIIYLYSVFSHMAEADVRAYLAEFGRLLAPGGRVFLTAFVEQNVPDVTVNPVDYKRTWQGPLHCVRYGQGFMEAMLAEYGFRVVRFEYGQESDGQSALYLALAGETHL